MSNAQWRTTGAFALPPGAQGAPQGAIALLVEERIGNPNETRVVFGKQIKDTDGTPVVVPMSGLDTLSTSPVRPAHPVRD